MRMLNILTLPVNTELSENNWSSADCSFRRLRRDTNAIFVSFLTDKITPVQHVTCIICPVSYLAIELLAYYIDDCMHIAYSTNDECNPIMVMPMVRGILSTIDV